MIANCSKLSIEALTRIAEAARLAPSAENLQPWHFDVGSDSITVSLDMSRRLDSDLNQMLGLTAMGTSAENAVVAASQEGLATQIELLTDQVSHLRQGLVRIARLTFDGRCGSDPLSEYISARRTSRRMDARRPLSLATLDELSQACREFSRASLHWVDTDRLREFATLVGLGNRIRLEHRPYYEELFRSLRFDPADAAVTEDGLDVRTLQLSASAVGTMRRLRHWRAMRIANLLGFSRLAAVQARNEVYGSGAVGFVTVPEVGVRNFFAGGQAFERLWLTATQLDLCFHPTASLSVFLAHARTNCEGFSAGHRKLVEQISERFAELFPEVRGRVMQIAFRVGYGPTPPVRSIRRRRDFVIECKT